MTLKELHGEACALSFYDFLEFDSRFLSSATMALQSIYNAVNITAKTKFFVKNSLPSSKIDEFYHTGGTYEMLTIRGAAYSMRLYGEGSFLLENEKSSFMWDFNCDGDVFHGLLDGETTLIFVGDFSYLVRDLVTFDEAFSSAPDSIPDGSGYSTIDLGKTVADFLCFDSMPRDKDGRVIECAALHDRKITFGPEFVGEAELVYRKRPILPSLDAPDTEIDLPAEYDVLLTLLTASYLLLDDDADKATYYKALYEQELSEIKKLQRSLKREKYVIADGWA